MRRHLLLLSAAVLLGLAACDSTPAPTAAAPTSTAPTSTAPATAAPVPTAPSTTAPVPTVKTSRTASAKVTRKPVRHPDCPSAKALERLVDLPEDWYFPASNVHCWKDWATAWPAGPNLGDGAYFFHYRPSAGWKYHSQGSAVDCASLGIKEPSPICYED